MSATARDITVSVSIVTYKTAHLLPACVTRVVQHVPHLTRIIIVNHSPEEEIVLEPMPVPITIHTQDNRGFGAGHNRAIEELPHHLGAHHIHLFLNPDVLLIEDVAPLVKHFNAPDVAAVGAQLIDSEHRKDIFCTGAAPTLLRTLVHKVAPPSLPQTATDVDWVSGAALLVRLADFQAVGGFDERYFLYFEDTDLCTRLRTQCGKRIIFDPSVHIVHDSGQSFESVTAQKHHYDASQDRYFTTHYTRPHATAQRVLRHIWRKLT